MLIYELSQLRHPFLGSFDACDFEKKLSKLCNAENLIDASHFTAAMSPMHQCNQLLCQHIQLSVILCFFLIGVLNLIFLLILC